MLIEARWQQHLIATLQLGHYTSRSTWTEWLVVVVADRMGIHSCFAQERAKLVIALGS